MKESNTEGIASHCGPESCGWVGNGPSEALTGEPDRPGIEPRKRIAVSDADPLVIEGRQHDATRDGECGVGPAGSETRSMSGRRSIGKREARNVSCMNAGSRGELQGDTSAKNAFRESDDCIVPKKVPNKPKAKAAGAEVPEERRSAKRNPVGQNTYWAQYHDPWAQYQGYCVESASDRMRIALLIDGLYAYNRGRSPVR